MKSKPQLPNRRLLGLVLVAASAILLSGHLQTVNAQWTTSGNNISNTNTGNVGVGTAAPVAPLHVGPNTFDPTWFNQHFGAIIMPNLVGGGGGGSGYGAYDRGLFINPTQTAAANGNSTVLYMYPTIATGVTQTNQYGLYVDNALGAGTATHYYPGVFMGGNVGIGTATPGKKLEILATDGEAVRLYRNANSVGWGVNMKFAFNNSNNVQVDYAGVHGLLSANTAGAEQGQLWFTTATSGSLTAKMMINGSGNVGIGATNPDAFGFGSVAK